MRKVFVCLVDIAVTLGLVFVFMRILDDQDYWQKAPYPLHVFLLLQYSLFALCIRMPMCGFRQRTSTLMFCFLFLIQSCNTWFGLYLIYKIRNQD